MKTDQNSGAYEQGPHSLLTESWSHRNQASNHERQVFSCNGFSWSSDRRWRSTRIWFYIDCHYHNLKMLTWKGACEQVEHVNGILRRIQKTCMCPYKAFKWSKHSQKRTLWVFLQYRGREMYYSHEWEFCFPVVHIFTLMSRGMRFPTIWHFDKCRLRRACAASFKA